MLSKWHHSMQILWLGNFMPTFKIQWINTWDSWRICGQSKLSSTKILLYLRELYLSLIYVRLEGEVKYFFYEETVTRTINNNSNCTCSSKRAGSASIFINLFRLQWCCEHRLMLQLLFSKYIFIFYPIYRNFEQNYIAKLFVAKNYW